MKHKIGVLIVFLLGLSFLIITNSSQAQNNLLTDTNGDGVVRILAFGDSITFGIGDGGLGEGSAAKGYPRRLETILSVPVVNAGNPGERIINASERFFSVMRSSNADLIILMEGSNDSIFRENKIIVRDLYQRLINGTKASGKNIAVLTLPSPCCDRSYQAPFADSYSLEARRLADINAISLVDLQRAWNNTCVNKGACELYNLPEGLHPNARGYDVIAQTVAARVLGIDILSAGGAAELEQATGLEPGTVIVKPNSAPN